MRFRRMADVLANQTQWLEAHNVVVGVLKDKVQLSEQEANIFKYLAQQIDAKCGLDPETPGHQNLIQEIKRAFEATEARCINSRDRMQQQSATGMGKLNRSAVIGRMRSAGILRKEPSSKDIADVVKEMAKEQKEAQRSARSGRQASAGKRSVTLSANLSRSPSGRTSCFLRCKSMSKGTRLSCSPKRKKRDQHPPFGASRGCCIFCRPSRCC